MFVSGCDKDDEPQVNCEQVEKDLLAAALTFGLNQTKANCEAYKKVLQQSLNSCSSDLTAQEKADAQEELNTLNCNAL